MLTRTARAALTKPSSRRCLSTLSALEEWPDLPNTSFYTPASSPLQSTTTSSGLTIITSPNSRSTSVTLTHSVGSASESGSQLGAAHVNQFLHFASSSSASTIAQRFHIENAGAHDFHHSDRTTSTVGISGGPEIAENAELLARLAEGCSFESWDVRDALAFAEKEVDATESDPFAILSQSIFAAAYGGPHTELGRTSHYPLYNGCDAQGVVSWRDNLTLKGSTVVGAGVKDHGKFVSTIESAFAGGNFGDAPGSNGSNNYTGGESRLAAGTPNAHVSLAVNCGTTGPMSMALRSYLHNALPEKFSGEAFASEGLVGIRGVCRAADAGQFVDGICSLFEGMRKAGDKAVENAILGAKADAEFDLFDSSLGVARAVTNGVNPDAFKAVDKEAFTKAAEVACKGGVSIASVGDVGSVPYHGSIKGRF